MTLVCSPPSQISAKVKLSCWFKQPSSSRRPLFDLRGTKAEFCSQWVSKTERQFKKEWSFFKKEWSFVGGTKIPLLQTKVSCPASYRKGFSISASWMTNSQIASGVFTLGTAAVLPFYTLMVLAPKAELTRKSMESTIPYIVLGVLYAYLLYLSWTPETLRLMFASKNFLPELPGIARMFSSEMTLASAWLHLLTIDLFAARQVFHDGIKNEVETRHSVSLCLLFCPIGVVSHVITKPRLSEAAADAVKKLLPDYAGGDLASLCSWADHVKFRYHWSSALHYIDTPDSLCTYRYTRDCHDEDGEKDRCVAGGINNYTSQIQNFGSSSSESQYNLTEALLFLSHFMGDIHQPLHVGFTSDRGGNTIDVHWYTRKAVLHHVWDTNIIETALERFYSSDIENMIDEIKQNITGGWANQVEKWEGCSNNKISCPDIYASESITAACDWAYKDVTEDSTLGDDYFLSRLPVVKLQLAESGVRLAATLNRALG